MTSRTTWLWATAACLAITSAVSAQPAPYPSKVIKLVIGFPPGGGADVVGRIIAEKASAGLGQQIIVDNRAGAAGMIAGTAVKNANPDGYTLLLGHVNAMAIAPAASAKPPYDAIKDFKPVAYVGFAPNVLVVNPQFTKASDVASLVALAKAKPGEFTFASPGPGSANQIAGEIFMKQAGIKMTHIPYRGSAPAITDLLGGVVTMNFDAMSSVAGFVKDGKMQPLAVTTPKRSAAMPDVPTMQELGYKDFNVSVWYGIVAPAATPDSVVARLNTEFNKAISDPESKRRLAELGVEVAPTTATKFAAQLRDDVARYGRIVKESNIRMD